MLKVALLGRPNVGKSTLFNALTHSRSALVANTPGLTRDRRYGIVEHLADDGHGAQCLLIDTGGMVLTDTTIDQQVLQQTQIAIDESDLICLLVSAPQGLVPLDRSILQQLRRTSNKPLWLVINKLDGRDKQLVCAEFAEAGIEKMFCVTALGRRHINPLRSALAALAQASIAEEAPASSPATKIAFIGRPNVGKSTLINRLIGKQRFITSAEAGTTRDSNTVELQYKGTRFVFIDTAGVKRRSRTAGIESLITLQTLEQIMIANIVVLVCDASTGVTRQDAILAGRILGAGRAMVVVLNKIDAVDAQQRTRLRYSIDKHFSFFHGFDIFDISALHNQGMARIFNAAQQAATAAATHISTARCNRLIQLAQVQHPPPRGSSGAIKLRYAYQSGTHPPCFTVYGSRVGELQLGYKRYLENFFRRQLTLKGTPVFFEFQQQRNPYVAERHA